VVSFKPWPLYPQGKSPWYPFDNMNSKYMNISSNGKTIFHECPFTVSLISILLNTKMKERQEEYEEGRMVNFKSERTYWLNPWY
jgi:hypothetical protein